MRIAGLEPTSFVDFPGKMAAVLFTPGCNLDCWYCHNRQLLAPGESDTTHDPDDVLALLAERADFLDAVTITGGCPTLQKDLAEYCARIKDLGLLVKVDTNGTRPWVIRDLIERQLVDFVAMDIKAPFQKYEAICKTPVDIDAVNETINLLMANPIAYEFRTTFAPELTTADILRIGRRIHGADRYVLQQYRNPGRGMDMFGLVEPPTPHPADYLRKTAALVRVFVRHVIIRGLDIETEFSEGSYVSRETSNLFGIDQAGQA
jgi:pyruvate formate lyase activating enzyme